MEMQESFDHMVIQEYHMVMQENFDQMEIKF